MKTRLVSLLMVFALAALGYSCSSAQAGGSEMQSVDIQTSAVCGTCKQTLEKAMSKAEGVSSSRLDLGNKVLTVEFDPAKTNADALRKLVTETGYDADGQPAVQTAHDNLPACCQKDSGLH
jgi:copper chaperone CopZ